MSLLLDALKRAEQEKHTRNGERPPPPPRAESPSPPAAANSPTAAGLELQPLGSPGGVPPQPAPRSEAAHAAQVMFAAKTPREEAAGNRGMLWATVGAIIVVVAAAGAYVWYSLRMLTPQLVAAAAVRPPPAPTPAPAAGMTIGELPAMGALPAPVRPGPAAAPVAEAPPPDPRKEPPTPRTSESLVSQILREGTTVEAPAVPARAPLSFAPTPEPAARVATEVTSGYDALRGGDLARARSSYQAALARDARSLDANLGMATVEARSGNRPAAASYYRRALEADPQNSTALAGLAGVADFARVEGLETRLLEDIGRQPRSAALHFALGNLFASQSRWHDAQAAYFEAHRLEPANADVAYNLAVSLDQLGQARLAADHYRRALEAARGQQPQFDPLQVERRLAELARATPR
ncbi:MAG TPA: tetratricopeptide repeat protein [Usitatibacter sp.]|nr:tetratricopeptide repeat protein [Usitatibacter sp.]